MTDEEAMKELERVIAEEKNSSPQFVIGFDPASKDGDKSVISINVLKKRESNGSLVTLDSIPSESLPPTHELTDEQLEMEVWMVSRTAERKQEVLAEIKLRAMKKGIENANEELAAELDAAEMESLKNLAPWKKKTQEEKEAEGKKKEDDTMERNLKRAVERNARVGMVMKDKWRDIANKAIKEKTGFGGLI